MFFVYCPTGKNSGILDLLTMAKNYVLDTIPRLSILFPILENTDDYDEVAFARCIKAMAQPSIVTGRVGRDTANEEKTRSLIILALNSYTGFLFIAQFATSNQNDKAKISQQIRMAQFLLSKLNDSNEWDRLAEAIWGSA